MRLHERLGRAERAETALAKQGRAVAWRITPAGAAWLASRALTALRNAQNAQEAEAYARDLHLAVDRMVVRAENPVRGPDQQSCSPGAPAVMITDHVPAARVPPGYATGRVAAAVPA